jgi:hypothetical protein
MCKRSSARHALAAFCPFIFEDGTKAEEGNSSSILQCFDSMMRHTWAITTCRSPVGLLCGACAQSFVSVILLSTKGLSLMGVYYSPSVWGRISRRFTSPHPGKPYEEKSSSASTLCRNAFDQSSGSLFGLIEPNAGPNRFLLEGIHHIFHSFDMTMLDGQEHGVLDMCADQRLGAGVALIDA